MAVTRANLRAPSGALACWAHDAPHASPRSCLRLGLKDGGHARAYRPGTCGTGSHLLEPAGGIPAGACMKSGNNSGAAQRSRQARRRLQRDSHPRANAPHLTTPTQEAAQMGARRALLPKSEFHLWHLWMRRWAREHWGVGGAQDVLFPCAAIAKVLLFLLKAVTMETCCVCTVQWIPAAELFGSLRHPTPFRVTHRSCRPVLT